MLFVVIFRSLAAEWGRYGMRFNVIQPGPIKTKVGLLVACECEGDTGVCADRVGALWGGLRPELVGEGFALSRRRDGRRQAARDSVSHLLGAFMPSVVAFCLICFNALLHLIVLNFYFVLKSLTLTAV